MSNKVTGVQMWKTSCCSPFPCTSTWTKIVDKGAGRSLNADNTPQNVGGSDLFQHKDMMYAGLSVSAGDRITAELIRIQPPDAGGGNANKFEVIIGEPRFNVDTPILNFLCAAPQDIDTVGGANDCA